MCAYGLPHLADLGAIDDRGFVSPPAPSHTLPSQWSLPPREWKWHFIPLRCVEWRCCAPPLSKTGGVTKTMRTMDCRSPSVALSVRLHVTRARPAVVTRAAMEGVALLLCSCEPLPRDACCGAPPARCSAASAQLPGVLSGQHSDGRSLCRPQPSTTQLRPTPAGAAGRAARVAVARNAGRGSNLVASALAAPAEHAPKDA